VAPSKPGLGAERPSRLAGGRRLLDRSSWSRSSWSTAPQQPKQRLGALELELHLLEDLQREDHLDAFVLEPQLLVDRLVEVKPWAPGHGPVPAHEQREEDERRPAALPGA
jgi:hypothetical protein